MPVTTKDNSQNLARLQELLGQHAGFRLDANAPSPEERTRIRASLNDAAVAAAESEIEMESLHPAGPWTDSVGYQRARARYLAHTALANGLSARLTRRRIHVGRQTKSSFKPVLRADTWDEVFAELQKKAVA